MFSIPRIKINSFSSILAKPEVDRFHCDTFDQTRIDLTVHEDDTGKFFIFHSVFQVYGWTTDPNVAFDIKGNMGIYTNHEIYEMMRGREITTEGM